MNKQHIDITNKEQVTAASTGSGKVTGPSWNPNAGFAREQAINEARIQAMEEHARQQAERHDVFETRRFQMMEMAIADLQKRLDALEAK